MDAQDRIIYAQTNKGTRIGTARDTIGAIRSGTPRRAWIQQQARTTGFDFSKALVNSAVKAEINHGRWMARCICGGAEEVDWQDPVFYCLSCGNMDYGGSFISAKFPADREIIETILLKRNMENRNWLPGETAKDLKAENEKHGPDSA